jgi:hypothetical protein
MITCAFVSAANELARFAPAAGAQLRRAAVRSRPVPCGRNGDRTLDTSMSNVLPTLVGGSAFSRGSGKLYREPGRHLTFLPLGFCSIKAAEKSKVQGSLAPASALGYHRPKERVPDGRGNHSPSRGGTEEAGTAVDLRTLSPPSISAPTIAGSWWPGRRSTATKSSTPTPGRSGWVKE